MIHDYENILLANGYTLVSKNWLQKETDYAKHFALIFPN